MADHPQHDLLPRRTSKKDQLLSPYKKERPRKKERGRGERRGSFFEGTRERAGKLKEGESFLNKREGNGKEAKEERGQATLKQQGGFFGEEGGEVQL
jgi:hypothetical protein